MRFGFALRLMGKAANAPILRESAARAESAGLDTIWVPDHIAIPPDQTEGSGGRYLDPLASLAWLAAATKTIHLGTAVLVVPYRPALPTAKVIATIQELSAGRLELGVGVGWMEAEFRAVGVDRHTRGRITDETLRFLRGAFAAVNDETTSKGQPFVFRPNPPRPRIWIGGGAPHALERAALWGDGWMPMTDDPKNLRSNAQELRSRFAEAGRELPEIAAFGAIGHEVLEADLDRLAALEEIGVTEYIQGARYEDLDGFMRSLDPLTERIEAYRAH
ncbi:MAG: TIGR03619 family F420-dependent LLM class oxidoreductase [bacterium]|nr:LLM class F420-dependent oxidoreductase [Deltaproteobacteria bacterium]MCP4906858.1 TIGR03619 family F420-dependent LLM class oxidoreductase [bacterium]